MNEPVCFPVCPKCAGGCELSSKLKTAPESTTKVRRWRPDIVTLRCGQEVVSPVFMFGADTEIWCEIHDEWETLAVKPKPKKVRKIEDVAFPF